MTILSTFNIDDAYAARRLGGSGECSVLRVFKKDEEVKSLKRSFRDYRMGCGRRGMSAIDRYRMRSVVGVGRKEMRRLCLKEYGEDVTVGQFETMVLGNPFVRELDFSGVWTVSGDMLMALKDSWMKDLTELGLAHCGEIEDDDMFRLVRGFQTLRLVKLDLSYTKLSDKFIAFLVSKCPNLKSFTCKGGLVGDFTLSSLAQFCKELIELNIDGCTSVSDFGISIVAQECRELKKLFMSELKITDETAKYLCYYSKNIEELSISDCNLTANAIFNLVSYLRNMVRLNAKNTQFNNGHLSNLPKTIKYLDVSFCHNTSKILLKNLFEQSGAEIVCYGIVN